MFPSNFRCPVASIPTKVGPGLPNPKAPGPKPASGLRETRTQTHGVVPSCEGNGVRREGRPGVAQRHSTVEAGELASEDPVEERALQRADPAGGTRGSPSWLRSLSP